jgi:prevent-host-death family protein
MRKIQSSDVKARLPEYLDAVERGETIVVTRHGKPIAHIVPAPAAQDERVREAIQAIFAMREEFKRKKKKISASEILAWRHEGHRY